MAIKATQYFEGVQIKGVKIRDLMIAPDESMTMLSVETYRGFERVEEGDFIVKEDGKTILIKRQFYNALYKAAKKAGD